MRCHTLSVVVLLSISAPAAFCSADGDLTNDGFVRLNDAVRAMRLASNPSLVADTDLLHGDVYPVSFPYVGDGQITVDDVRVILRTAAGLGSIPKGPTSVSATTTGSGRIAVYLDAYPGASGYKIYRREANQSYGAPTALAPQPTYSGSSVLVATDTGLTDGTAYYYVVTATVNGQDSAPSNEVSAFPDSRGIPWDLRNAPGGPSAVLAAVRSLYSGSGLPIGPGQGILITGGPDRSTYTEDAGGNATVAAPNGTIDPSSGEIVMNDGTRLVLPNDKPILVKGARRTVTWPNAGGSGPFRRIQTRPNVDFTGIRGTVTLVDRDDDQFSSAPGIYLSPADLRWRDPATGQFEVNPDGSPRFRSTNDNPCTYFGLDVQNLVYIEGGLYFDDDRVKAGADNSWHPYMSITLDRALGITLLNTNSLHDWVAYNPSDPGYSSSGFSAHAIGSTPDVYMQFGVGPRVAVTIPHPPVGSPAVSSTVYVSITQPVAGAAAQSVTITQYAPVLDMPRRATQFLQMKRVHSIAQNLPPTFADQGGSPRTGYLLSGSHVFGSAWKDGEVQDPTGTITTGWRAWSLYPAVADGQTGDTDEGSYPARNIPNPTEPYVSWTSGRDLFPASTIPWTIEQNITLDMCICH